ncbi:hypothetical protein SLEP1_g26266 [Rubroshorea leprosula]|uniref:Uncharacterized protein n=1 Tax=Rubroshorea leprosula TaxID=152421 RepID=A0AAV5JVS6_9ROSI|nr:hypothetical protein SLEP1_g26266 [Rubroshorea leprosula]
MGWVDTPARFDGPTIQTCSTLKSLPLFHGKTKSILQSSSSFDSPSPFSSLVAIIFSVKKKPQGSKSRSKSTFIVSPNRAVDRHPVGNSRLFLEKKAFLLHGAFIHQPSAADLHCRSEAFVAANTLFLPRFLLNN